MSVRRLTPYLSLALLVLALAGISMKSASSALAPAQDETLVAGRNVNMVSGTKLPLGDPWLQRQDEPSVAVSTRNPMHLFAAANDYRTIDMSDPYVLRGIPGMSAVRDSWVGVFESFNYGESWITTLLPGFPQDSSTEGQASPIHGFDTACDPIVRAGAQGLFYFSGIAFNRSQQAGAVFVARYVDLNNREKIVEEIDPATKQRKYTGPIEYMDTRLVDAGNPGQFIDMPNMAVDVPRSGAPYGNVYLAYTVFMGNANLLVRSRVVFVRSTDGGVTWSSPIKLTESQHIIQRPIIAIDPSDPTGKTIYVAFRRFAFGNTPGGIVFLKSINGGVSFTKPADVATLRYPFDQYTTTRSFRTNSYPTMAVDGNGIAYMAWAQRPSLDGQARIVMSYLPKGSLIWETPQPVDQTYTGDGHQFMPTMTFGGGKLTLAWYDQRDDISLHHDNAKFIEDVKDAHRHTIDVRAAEGTPGTPPVFLPSIPVSRYLFYMELDSNGEPKTAGGEIILIQGEANFINYNLFELGTKPFHGDYMEIVSSPQILPPPATISNAWTFNTSSSEPTTSPIVWTDNRDVWPPGGNIWGDWTSYNPPTSSQDLGFGQENPCIIKDTTGMRNQNVYTANLNHGVIVGSPGNTKQLDIQRSFVVFVKNTTEFEKQLNLSLIPSTGVTASFEQSSSVSSLGVTVLPYSSVSCTVYVDSSGSQNGFGPVEVDIMEGGDLVGRVFLNPDSTNNAIIDPSGTGVNLGPELHNPKMSNPKVWKYDVGNPNEPNASVLSPRAQNPRAQNSGYVNPRAQNSAYVNPRAQNPRAQNPRVQNENIVNNEMLNPRAQNPRVQNAALTDMTWTVTNDGNTTSAYRFDIVSDSEYIRNLFNLADPPLIGQILVYKVHTVPIDRECELTQTHADELIVNVSNPRVQNPRAQNTAPTASTIRTLGTNTAAQSFSAEDITFNLAPGEEAEVIFRVYDPDINDPYSFDGYIENFAGETEAEAVNTGDDEPILVTQPDVPWVDPLPAVVASPISMSFSASGSQTLSLSLSGLSAGESLAYSLSDDADWLTVTSSDTAGTLNGTPLGHTVAIDVSNLPAGSYAGSITVAVPEAYNNPLRIPVYLNTNGNSSPNMIVSAGESSIDDGGTYDFGSAGPGTTSDITFRIDNNGLAGLILGGKPIITITGANADQFSVQQQPTSPVLTGGSTAFIMRFKPTSLGSKTATISIINNTLNTNPYDIGLHGIGDTDLVAYYPFNGNANDESGLGNNGVVSGATLIPDRFGNPDSAFSFDGLNDIITTTQDQFIANNELTVSLWVNAPAPTPPSPNNTQYFAVCSDFGIAQQDDQVGLSIWTPNTNHAGGTITFGEWHHLVGTYDGTFIRAYIDGTLVEETSWPGVIVDPNYPLTFGFFNNVFWPGALDDVRIYNRALSALEVHAIYSAESAGANSWTPAGLPANDIRVISVDPANSSTIYAGTFYQGFFKSVNGGSSWQNPNFPGNGIMSFTSVEFDSLNPASIYVLSYSGLFKSTDSGATWAAIPFPISQSTAMAIDPMNPSTLYLGLLYFPTMPNSGGVLKSIDGGATWLTNTLQNITVTCLAIDPSDPSRIYAGTFQQNGIYMSTDGGNSWTVISSGITDSDITALAVNPSTPTTIYAGTSQGGVFRSTDGGNSWSPVNTGLTNLGITVDGLCIDRNSPSIIYVGTKGDGVFKSTNGGDSWSPWNFGLPRDHRTIQALTIDPSSSKVYAGTGAGIFVNGGH